MACSLPVGPGCSGPSLGDIAEGDDGSSFCFAETSTNRVGKITTQEVITEYLLPLRDCQPSAIANGLGDTFWFTYPSSSGTNYIRRLTGTSWQLTLYTLPA